MTTPTPSSSTSPLPQPDGNYVYSPKVLGQSSKVRQEIALNTSPRVGLTIIIDDELSDPEYIKATTYHKTNFNPDADPLGAVMDTRELGDIDVEEPGVYSFALEPAATATPGHVTVVWQYTVDGLTYYYTEYYQVMDYMPVYETLTDGEKGVVRIVSMMFEDLYDSVEGGPHLKEEFQTHFGAETIARCMELAMSRINITSQPYTKYNIGFGEGPRFPAGYYSLLIMGTYLEVVRHLRRSYVEMPTMQGSPGVAYYDRSNYMDRWGEILKDEAEDFKAAVRGFKRSLLGLGGGSLIVAGGIYGSIGSGWRSGMYSAQTRAARFMYPASVVQVRPSGS